MSIIIAGITTENKQVIAGVFSLVSTHGTPLELILYRFKAQERIIDWIDYIQGALADGHNPKTIRARILGAVGDVYGSDYREEISKRLNILFNED